MTNNPMREAFESWATREGLNLNKLDCEEYRFGTTEIAWEAWQAALVSVQPAESVDQAAQGGTTEEYLRMKYGAYRGHHAWRELEEAFNAGKASQPVSSSLDERDMLLAQAADALAYGAFNFDGSKLSGLNPQLIESTGVSETMLIAERNIRNFIDAARIAPSSAPSEPKEPK